jgi:hypothetical protein
VTLNTSALSIAAGPVPAPTIKGDVASFCLLYAPTTVCCDPETTKYLPNAYPPTPDTIEFESPTVNDGEEIILLREPILRLLGTLILLICVPVPSYIFPDPEYCTRVLNEAEIY